MANTGEFHSIPEEDFSIRQELREAIAEFKKEINYNLPASADEEMIALCALMSEVPQKASMEESVWMPKILRWVKGADQSFFKEQDGRKTSENILAVQAYLGSQEQGSRHQFIDELESHIANEIEGGGHITLSLLALLGVVSQYRTEKGLNTTLSDALDKSFRDEDSADETESSATDLFLSVVEHQLRTLGDINHHSANVLLHKIFDFMEDYHWTLSNSGMMQPRYTPHGLMSRLFDATFRSQVNYLVWYHRELISEVVDEVELGPDSGVARLDSEERYLAKKKWENIKSRFLIGRFNIVRYDEDYLPLEPGYVAEYLHGKMAHVFHVTEEDYLSLDEEIARALAMNSSEDNQRFMEYVRQSRDQRPADAFLIYDFLKGTRFFVDIDALSKTSHSLRLDELNSCAENNYRLLLERRRNIPPREPISKEEFYKKLFPGQPFDQAVYEEYSYLMRPQMRGVIEDDFILTLSDYPSWVHRNFLSFLLRQDWRVIARLKSFVNKFGSDALKSFLATEADMKFGETLMDIGEIPGELPRGIFKKYGAIAQTAHRAADYLRENFGGEATAEPTVRAFTENLLMRGKELLRTASTKKDQTELLAELETIDEQTSMICAGVAAMKGKHLDLEDVKPIRLDEWTSEEMRGHQEIVSMMRVGYEKTLRKEWGDNAKVDRLLAEFDARVNDPGNKSRFYVILRADKAKNPLIGSTVFTDTAPGEKFWSALFFETAYRGSGFYPSIIMQALEKESEDALIRGKTSAWKDVAASYIEQAQFEGVRFHYDEEEQDGALIIERSVHKKAKPEIPSPLPSFSLLDVSDQIAEKKPKIEFEADTRDLFDPRMMQEIFAPLSRGYVLSRYTKDAEHARLVFEYRG